MREVRVLIYRRITQDKSPVMDNRSSVKRMERRDLKIYACN